MELVRAMVKNHVKNDETAEAAARQKKDEVQHKALVQATEAELGAAKRELETIKAGSFQFMTSMDRMRTKIMRVVEEISRLNTTKLTEEGSQGKTEVSLLVLHRGSSMSIEAAKRAIQKFIDTSRTDLLSLVLREERDVPRPCKDLFWKVCKILHLFYFQTDGFSSPKEMVSAVNAVINEPFKLQVSNPSLAVSSEK